MRRSLPALLAFCCALAVRTAGQAASSLSLSGLSTGSLSSPAAPLSVTGYGTCSGAGTNTWGYAVAAVDGAGGTTNATSFGPATTGTCTTLTNNNYFTFTTQAVPGAVRELAGQLHLSESEVAEKHWDAMRWARQVSGG